MKKVHKPESPAAGAGAVNLLLTHLKGRIALLLTAFIGAAFGFVSLGAYIVQSQRSELVPYLVTVDKQGVVLNQGPIQAQTDIPEAAVASALCSFVSNVRRVSSDDGAQRAAITAVYSHIKDGTPAQAELDRFYNQQNPFERGRKERVEAVISNVIAQAGSTYQIDWQERVTGEMSSRVTNMRALISYEVSGSRGLSPEDLLLNPLGIYVTDFVVSPLLV